MAQYYHLVGQSEQTLQTVTLEELRQCYPNITCIESTNGVQYVINQDDAGTQFQSQQMLLTDQQIVLNAGEAHSQQIIVDQSQISFAQPQYINTDGEIVNEYQPDDLNSTQQVFYTTAVAGDMNNAKQRLLQTQLINQQQQIASQQIAVAQQAVAQPCIAEQTQQVRSVVQQPQQVNNNLVQVRRVSINADAQQTIVSQQPAGTNDVALQFPAPQLPQEPVQETQRFTETDENELVKLSDGRIMTLGQYNQEVRKNQENQNVAQSPIAGQEMQEAKTYKQPTPKRNYKRQPQTPNNRGRGVNRGGRGNQSIRGRRPSEPGQIGLAVSPLTTAIHAPAKPPLQYSPHKNVNKPAMQQNVMQQMHMQQPNAHNNMQQQNIIGANMQGYTPGRPQPPIPLSPQVHNGHAMQNISYSPTNQLQQLLDDSSSSVSDEYKDSAKMLVCLENGEQRLITFTIPKESCTVQDLLEQVGVPFNADTNIECMNNTGGDIDYIVSVGAVNNITAVVDEQQAFSIDNVCETQEFVVSQTGAMIPAAETNQPKPPEKAPEPPKEVPKFVPGYLAVCGHCGYVSEDFNRCQRCRTKLPDDPKTITTKNESSPATDNKKTELARLQNKALQKPNAKFNNSKTVPKTAVRRLKSKTADLESVILTLSSDDEDTSRSNMSSNATKMFNSERLAVIDKEPNISEYGSDIDDEEVLEGISGTDL